MFEPLCCGQAPHTAIATLEEVQEALGTARERIDALEKEVRANERIASLSLYVSLTRSSVHQHSQHHLVAPIPTTGACEQGIECT